MEGFSDASGSSSTDDGCIEKDTRLFCRKITFKICILFYVPHHPSITSKIAFFFLLTHAFVGIVFHVEIHLQSLLYTIYLYPDLIF